MRYAFLAYSDEAAHASLSAPEREAEVEKFAAFVQEVEQRGIREANARLQPSSTATTVRAREGRLIIGDGPYAETKEQLGGLFILNCKDLDEAIQFAGKFPVAGMGVVEIRPLADA